MYDRFDNSGAGAGNWFFMVLMMVLVVLAVVIVVHHLSNANDSSSKGDKSLEILKHRYAKGEIDKKEFEEKRKDLKS
jgi:putative membrane protein